MQSPHLLMLSGIGDAEELKQHGIELKHHLPGVGKNFHDHPDFIFGYSFKEFAGTFGISMSGSLDMFKQIKQIGRYRSERRGMIASNFAECGGFIKSSPALKISNLQLHFVVALVDDHACKFRRSHGISCHVCLLNPRSRGSIKLSGPNIHDPLLIDPNFLNDERDLDDLVQSFKLTQKLMQSSSLSSLYKQDLFTAHVKNDEDIREILRNRVDTVYHPVGSCKMGVDDMSVVDPELCVYGIQNLRVIDASVMPSVVNGNTNAPTIMIAEKAVDLIRARQQTSKVA
ncbi:GMC family oxidoreductase [Acinetobacter sp. ACNIH3]|uniref:GMC family oxidoreductase n=1 Tax=Acinetobacter sp. ACNIH3 TaxID=1985874 RepID=UPI003A0FCF14